VLRSCGGIGLLLLARPRRPQVLRFFPPSMVGGHGQESEPWRGMEASRLLCATRTQCARLLCESRATAHACLAVPRGAAWLAWLAAQAALCCRFTAYWQTLSVRCT